MRYTAISAAVAAVLAASAAQAVTITVTASGASAQRSFWQQDLGGICTGTFNTGLTIFSVTTPPGPDIQVAQCTVITAGRGTIPLPAGLNNGDVLVLQYPAELGSVWGIAPKIPTNRAAAGRRMLDFTNPAVCPSTTCTVTGYNAETDTATTGLTAKVVPDLLVTDLEPTKWVNPDNWPLNAGTGLSFNILGDTAAANLNKSPTLAELQTAQAAFTRVNGQVFSVITHPGVGVTNLSTNSLRAIFTGQYSDWKQVPEYSGASLDITVCRRDHGSGTQVASSTYFTGTECNVPGAATYVTAGNGPNLPANGGNLNTSVLENASTNALANCVTSNPGAIGVRSLSTSTAYTTVSIDGVEANAHNSAAGSYAFAFDTFVFDNTTASGATAAEKTVVSTLITDAKLVTRLPVETGALAGGKWAATGTRRVAFGGEFLGSGNPGSPSVVTDLWTTAKAPEAIYNQLGDACNSRLNLNNN